MMLILNTNTHKYKYKHEYRYKYKHLQSTVLGFTTKGKDDGDVKKRIYWKTVKTRIVP